MRTAIVSDLHLGSAHGEDVLRDPAIRRVLLDELESADRIVLLGDVLELRESSLAKVLGVSRPFFEELGGAMKGRQILLVPGNHDHRLAESLLEQIAISEQPTLSLEHRSPPSGETSARIAGWLGKAELSIAYPGLWLRDDVYATHGHYMDCHMSLPRAECVAAAALMRPGNHPPDPAVPGDYERILRPIYGFTFGLAQSSLRASASRPSERAWRSLTGSNHANGRTGRARRVAARAAIGAGIPAAIWTLNRMLHANFAADLSAAAITRSGVEAASEMARRLRIDATHVISGHTHRGGPREGEAEWALPGGGQLHNTGSWVFASVFHRPGTPPGPYWPGTVTWVEDEGPPRRVQLLAEHPHKELAATVSRSRSGG
jgi:UDP-2,3-diacylglucosamine pyrophosphatase LpxH